MCVHVSLVPVIGVVGEQKTKPTQHSVATLRSLGINPALLACRSSEPLQDSVRSKLVRCGAGARAPAVGRRARQQGGAPLRGWEQSSTSLRHWSVGHSLQRASAAGRAFPTPVPCPPAPPPRRRPPSATSRPTRC